MTRNFSRSFHAFRFGVLLLACGGAQAAAQPQFDRQGADPDVVRAAIISIHRFAQQGSKPTVGPQDKVTARGRATQRASAQPANSINVRVRYRKEYGYRGDTSAFGYVGPTSCDAFSVFVAAGAESGRPTNLIAISSDSRMEDAGGQYVCSYLVSELPLGAAINISVTLSNNRELPTEMWKGGSEAQPPPGQRRTILDNERTVMLTVDEPRTALGFEMIYAPLPLTPPMQRVPRRRPSVTPR